MGNMVIDKILETPPDEIEQELIKLRKELDNEIPKKALDKNLLIATWNIRSFGDLTEKWTVTDNDSPKRNLHALRCITEIISRFTGEYDFLSTYFPGGQETLEHEYQARKTFIPADREYILSARTPMEAKLRGMKVSVRPDWGNIQYGTMFCLVLKRFKSDRRLTYKLLQTGKKQLINVNYYHDNFFGDCQCPKCKNITGQNRLGEILMIVRQML